MLIQIPKSRRRENGVDTRESTAYPWYIDWFEYNEKKVIAYQDDASRYILSMRECDCQI